MRVVINLSKEQIKNLKKTGNVEVEVDLPSTPKENTNRCECWSIIREDSSFELYKCGKWFTHAGSRNEALENWTKEGCPACIINEYFDHIEWGKCGCGCRCCKVLMKAGES